MTELSEATAPLSVDTDVLDGARHDLPLDKWDAIIALVVGLLALFIYGRTVTPGLLPGGSPAAVRNLVGDLEVLSLRQQELLRAGAQDLPPELMDAMRADLRAWHQEILKVLSRLAADPGAIDPDGFRVGLDQAMEHMEDRIRQTMDRPERIRLNEQEGVSFLQLLAAYRGEAGAVADYAGSSTTVNWPSWREARFA